MRARRALATLVLVAALPGVAACGRDTSPTDHEGAEHAKVEPIPGSDVKRVVLTTDGAKALGIQTVRVQPFREDDGGRALVVPYAAVIYDSEGRAFVYTNPAPLTFVRRRIVVDDIHDRKAYLAKGPPAGTSVVTVGADELLGAEEGVQE